MVRAFYGRRGGLPLALGVVFAACSAAPALGEDLTAAQRLERCANNEGRLAALNGAIAARHPMTQAARSQVDRDKAELLALAATTALTSAPSAETVATFARLSLSYGYDASVCLTAGYDECVLGL